MRNVSGACAVLILSKSRKKGKAKISQTRAACEVRINQMKGFKNCIKDDDSYSSLRSTIQEL